MSRALVALAAIVALALALVALGLRASVETPADFRFVNGTEPRTLDPGLATGQPEGRVLIALFEGLLRYDERTMEPVPGVAESHSVSADGLRYEFRLRADARWSDGAPVTAHDFAWSWRRLQQPALGSEYAFLLHMVRHAKELNLYGAQADALRGPVREAFADFARAHARGASAAEWQAFARAHGLHELAAGDAEPALARALAPGAALPDAAAVDVVARAIDAQAARRARAFADADAHFGVDEGVFAVDDRTLVVELRAPTPYFPAVAAFYTAYPVPRHVVEAPGNASDWFLPGKIATNGPFRLESWAVHHRIRLVRSDTYWGRDEVALARVDVLPIEHQATALNLYLTGEVDWLPDLFPAALADALRARDDFYAQPGLSVYYYKLRTTAPPLDDVRVRRALNLAIDRRVIVDEVLGLGQVPASHFVPPGMAGYTPPPSALRFDPAEARRLLAESGHPGGEGIDEVGILYNTNEEHRKIAEVVADQLRRHLGIRARAYNQEWQSFLATLRAGDFEIARSGWIGDYEDPNTFLDMWVTDGPNNNTGWSDPLYDLCIASAADVGAFVARPDALAHAWKEPGAMRAALEAARAPARDPAARVRALEALRMQLLREAEARLLDDGLPIVPLYFRVNAGLLAPRVQGLYTELERDGARSPNLRDIHPLRGIRIAAAATDAITDAASPARGTALAGARP
ncbi:MAG: peptide ABC transporter substrate-binding protein [Myxococcota bacterium]